MMNESAPLVSVVTPVYNGERYLAQCIESVLAQTYTNWEYIVNDNCSTDRTPEIAGAYAARDSRIRVYRNDEFVRAIPNHNIAIRHIAAESRYCKVLNADDWLFPECLSRMVAVAETYPSVGIVSSYRLEDRWVRCDGLPYPSAFVTGRVIGRFSLMDGWTDLFGSMSTPLFRSELTRTARPFYNEAHLYADTEACFQALAVADFGFVHQVLSYSRVHPGQLSSFQVAYGTLPLARVALTKQFGPHFLDDEEYRDHLQRALDRYYAALGSHLVRGKSSAFWSYHRAALADLGVPFEWHRVALSAFGLAGRTFARPFGAVRKAARTLLARGAGAA